MKKFFVLGGISVLLFLGCASTSIGIVYNNSVPAERSAQLFIANIGRITGYNGVVVDWNPGRYASKTIQIPAGDTLLEFYIDTFGYEAGASGPVKVIYKGKQLFRFNFQPQKKYYFVYNSDKGIQGLNVYAVEPEETIGRLENPKYFVAFVPFARPDGRTILN